MPVSESALWSEWIWVPPGFAHGNFFEAESRIDTTMRQNTAPAVRQVSPLAGDIDWSLAPALRDSIPSPAASC